MSPTRYTVIASDEVNDELTTIWLNHPAERKAITQAAHIFETALRRDAESKGAQAPPPAPPTQ